MSQTSAHRMENKEDSTQKILRSVVYDKAFVFYESIGKPAGVSAVSLSDLNEKINTISSQSLVFHLKRGDFENWIRETLGDSKLSQQIKKLKTRKTLWKNDASIRTKLHATIRNRITELQDS